MSLAKRLSRLVQQKTTLSYGLEISDRALRLAAVPKAGEKAVPYALHEIPLSFVPDSLQAVNASPEIKGALKNLVQQFGIHKVHVGIPERHFFFRCIQVPAMKGQNWQEELHMLIDDYLVTKVVLPRRDVVCEYDIIAEADGQWYVAIAVVPKQVVRRYQALLELVGLSPISIEANVHAMRMSCIEDLAHQMSLSVRIEDGTAHAAIMNGQAVFFDRDFILPNRPEAAQKFVLGEVVRMYRDWLRQPYRHKLERQPIGQITLFGGNPDLELLREALSEELHLPVRVASPLKSEIESHDLEHTPPTHAKNLHRFSAAIGLAMAGR